MCASDFPFTWPEQIAVGVAMGLGTAVILILVLIYGVIYWRKRMAGAVESPPESTIVSGPMSEKATEKKA